MFKKNNWIKKPPEKIKNWIEDISNNQTELFLIKTLGPTNFIIKQGKNDFKTTIGNTHSCSCKSKRNSSTCLHILFILMKVLKVKSTCDYLWQKELTDSQLRELMRNFYKEEEERRKEIELRKKEMEKRRRKEEEEKRKKLERKKKESEQNERRKQLERRIELREKQQQEERKIKEDAERRIKLERKRQKEIKLRQKAKEEEKRLEKVEKFKNESKLRKPIEKEDNCSICLCEMYDDFDHSLTFCECCGKSFHIRCMKMIIRHARKHKQSVKCPLCRWTIDEERINSYYGKQPKKNCSNCKRIFEKKKDTKYKCCHCEDYNLCETCFSSKRCHSSKKHEFFKWNNGKWELATRPNSSKPIRSFMKGKKLGRTFSDPINKEFLAKLNELQFRELSEEDYELLTSGLQDVKKFKNSIPLDLITTKIPSLFFRKADLKENETTNNSCAICLCNFEENEEIKKLKYCGHQFHSHCIEKWLVQGKNSCPICVKMVFEVDELYYYQQELINSKKRKRKRKKKTTTSSRNHGDNNKQLQAQGFKHFFFEDAFDLPPMIQNQKKRKKKGKNQITKKRLNQLGFKWENKGYSFGTIGNSSFFSNGKDLPLSVVASNGKRITQSVHNKIGDFQRFQRIREKKVKFSSENKRKKATPFFNPSDSDLTGLGIGKLEVIESELREKEKKLALQRMKNKKKIHYSFRRPETKENKMYFKPSIQGHSTIDFLSVLSGGKRIPQKPNMNRKKGKIKKDKKKAFRVLTTNDSLPKTKKMKGGNFKLPKLNHSSSSNSISSVTELSSTNFLMNENFGIRGNSVE